MKVAIAGGTGLIGKAVTNELISEGHHVYILTRDKSQKQDKHLLSFVEWLSEGTQPEIDLDGIDAFINLAGENLNSGRWTTDKKKEIMQSRIDATQETIRIVEAMKNRPNVLVNGSAVGYYGNSYSKTFTELDREPGDNFLADVVHRWETEAMKVPEDVRLVCPRFGVVLDINGGALKKMLPAFKLFAGGKLGTGEQWMSWVHITDVAKGIVHCILHEEIDGPVNFTAPEPQRMKDFGKTLADKLNRPFWAPVPSSVLHILLGEMSVLVLEGQKVIPKKLLDSGYTFTYPHLSEALSDLLSKEE
ncbi:TIGR01777 family oxidoreductase [Salipaludibacillus daqingensis]|uniref:TIGR01777 family oxidoreductase n=1 Tax=Salipaludibacillus daqingensis TaxID=3041001 RepID=UPI002474DA3D|nr:TIGR01777 family oxidoreductase [Salipaludibacillus daqingensis]